MAGKAPSFQFYPGDWLHNAKLQACSLEARGLLIDMMCFIHQSEKYGFFKINSAIPDEKTITKLLRIRRNKFRKLTEELLNNGVLIRGNCGVFICKRMVEDQILRDKRAAIGRTGGNPALLNLPVNPPTKSCTPPSSSSSSSPSSTKKKRDKGIPLSSVLESFNSICITFPRASETPTRKSSFRASLKTVPLETWRDVFTKAEASDFLSGRNGKWTGCSFDWFVKPTNRQKVIEGNYDNDRGGTNDPDPWEQLRKREEARNDI